MHANNVKPYSDNAIAQTHVKIRSTFYSFGYHCHQNGIFLEDRNLS